MRQGQTLADYPHSHLVSYRERTLSIIVVYMARMCFTSKDFLILVSALSKAKIYLNIAKLQAIFFTLTWTVISRSLSNNSFS